MNDLPARSVAPVAIALLVLIGAARSPQSLSLTLVAVAVAIVAVGFLRSAGWALLVPALVTTTAVALVCSGEASNVGWFALCVLAGVCAFQAGAAVAVTFSAAAIGVFLLQWAVISGDPGWSTWIVGTMFTTLTCLMARRQHGLLVQLRAAQAGLADRARAEERVRISRELHDVIAHSLTVSLLHVSSARLAVDEDPAEAAAALAEAERLGRRSLTEVRQAVGLLRDEDGTISRAPMPGVDQIAGLIDGFRRAGVPVSFELLGDLSGFTATAGLTVYRILQEALTNAARHAPGAEIHVQIKVSADQTVLTVDNTQTVTPSAPAQPTTNGYGLSTMRERAEALGGNLEAGPSPTKGGGHDAGWRVRALLPGQPFAVDPVEPAVRIEPERSR
jgi:signal transduction histidine kinase